MSGFDDLPICEQCGARFGGSHYHCSCGSLAVTGMYGHHSTRCKVTGKDEGFHHCGPDGDCDRTERQVQP